MKTFLEKEGGKEEQESWSDFQSAQTNIEPDSSKTSEEVIPTENDDM